MGVIFSKKRETGVTEVVTLNNGKKMPLLGVGTATHPPPPAEVVTKAVLEAIELGYRMFDTAAMYEAEQALGEAISQALDLGLIKSRDEVFIVSKLYCNDNRADHVIPALQKTLMNLKLGYLDQYLIQWPVSIKHDANPADVVPVDMKAVWTAMEKCQALGLTKSIGVSNFTCKKLADILQFAKIPPAVNQVEMNIAWQQGKLRELCKVNGIVVSMYSPLGAPEAMWGTKSVLESKVLKEIAESKGKSVAQVALRWAYEQGVVIVTKSFNKGRLQQNLDIFDWKFNDEDIKKIAAVPQVRANEGNGFISETGLINCSIPVIDLHDFPAQSSKLIQACQEWGCFRLINYQKTLPESLMSEMKCVVSSLFELPPEIKFRNSSEILDRGYMAPSQNNPLYEAFGLFVSSPRDVDDFCSSLNASPHQRATIIEYVEAVRELFADVSGKLAEGLGISDFTIQGWPCQLRINKYNFAQESVGSRGVQLHTDSGFITILQDDKGVGGLEVMDKSGAFVPVDPRPGTLVVNLGDAAAAWSNGRFRNVKHRVQCKEGSLRYSIASFLWGPNETVEAPAELVDSAHPRVYAPFIFEDYRKLRVSTNKHAGEALDLFLLDSQKSCPSENGALC